MGKNEKGKEGKEKNVTGKNTEKKLMFFVCFFFAFTFTKPLIFFLGSNKMEISTGKS